MHNIHQTITTYQPHRSRPLFSRPLFYSAMVMLTFILFVSSLSASVNASAKTFTQIEWIDLIPQDDLDVLLNPPESLMAIPDGSAFDVLPNNTFGGSLDDSLDGSLNSSLDSGFDDGFDSEFDISFDGSDPLANAVDQAIASSTKILTPEEQRYYAALESTRIKEEFRNKDIRLAGFVVPVEYGDNQVITEFFLVPYFGACIHMPAPPPNQIIYVKYPSGLTIDALYDPFWIEGELHTAIVENDLALSAYSLNAENIKPYEAYQQ